MSSASGPARRARRVRLRAGERGVFTQMPAGMSFEEAAAVRTARSPRCPACGAADLKAGPEASSSTAPRGRSALRPFSWRRHFDADVTAVCNTENVELVHSLGADRVLDYTRGEDFTKNGESYDIVLDAVGKLSYRRCRGSLKAGGVYAATDLGCLWNVPLLALLTRWVGDKRISIRAAGLVQAGGHRLRQGARSRPGEYRPVIDRRYPLEDVVEATRYVETGQKVGNVVLTVLPRALGESRRPRPVRAAGRAPARGGREARAEGGRDSDPDPRHDREPVGLRLARPAPVLLARSSPASCGRSGRSSAASWQARSRPWAQP